MPCRGCPRGSPSRDVTSRSLYPLLMPHGCAGDSLPKVWGATGSVQGEGLGLRGTFPTHSPALGVATSGEPGPRLGVSYRQHHSLGAVLAWSCPPGPRLAGIPSFSISHLM